MTISDRIFYLLALQKRKQKELADFIGVSGTVVSEWKKKGTNPSANKIFHISEFFNVTCEWLLTGEGEMYNNTSSLKIKNETKESSLGLSETEEIIIDAYRIADRKNKNIILQTALEISNSAFTEEIPKSKIGSA